MINLHQFCYGVVYFVKTAIRLNTSHYSATWFSEETSCVFDLFLNIVKNNNFKDLLICILLSLF